jgi:Arc/MetJ-type ribon-helix-helix transcriptional regulator
MAPISVRLDQSAEEALAYLESHGVSRSEAIRRGVTELADRERRAEIRRQAAEVAADPDDRAEMLRILEQMEALAPEDEV